MKHFFANLSKFSPVLAVLFSAAAHRAQGQSIVALYSFTNGLDGATPRGGLIQASNGVLYGTTLNAGTNQEGTIFTITTNGAFAPLYSFKATTNDASGVYANLLQGTNGIFYGAASQSGFSNNGSIFKITSAGAFTELYGFNSLHYHAATLLVTNGDGSNPTLPLIQGTNGNFYGTTSAGGSNGFGAVFEITATGAFTRLHSFSNGIDGAYPGALLQSSNGLIYGTTTNGGTNTYGGIFKMTSAGVLTPIYSFTNGVDGSTPGAALTQATNGVLYGTTSGGGTNGSGTIFQITTNGVFTPLYSFALDAAGGLEAGGTNADGTIPGALVQGGNGIFYGYAAAGGLNGTGTLFQFSLTSGFTLLYTFQVGPNGLGGVINTNGAEPSGIILANDGAPALYGTTRTGGPDSYGTIFQLGLPPVITSQPASLSQGTGTTARFSITASLPSCQWQFNNTNIPHATNLSLTNLNIQATNAGLYQAIVSNVFGSVTSMVAYLDLTNVPVFFATGGENVQYAGGRLSLLVTNLTGQGSVIIDASSDLRTWTPLITNPPSFGQFPFTDSSAGNYDERFYRTRITPEP